MWDKMLPKLEGKIADLGCGPCMIYKGKDVDLTGVDSSEEAINQAKINYPKGNFVVADSRKTGLPSESFDSVIMLGLLDYFEEWEEVLVEARRILKPGGFILATLYNGFQGHDWTEYEHLTGEWYLYTEQV